MPKAPRAPRVVGPGAVRLTLTGIMAVTDDFKRVRILLIDVGRDSRPDLSWLELCKSIPDMHPDYRTPHRITHGPLPPSADGVRGEFWVVLPARHEKHWLKTAEELRGKWVRAEVTVRPYSYDSGAGRVAGASLDLSMLEPLAV